jgi:hypothetical protein
MTAHTRRAGNLALAHPKGGTVSGPSLLDDLATIGNS